MNRMGTLWRLKAAIGLPMGIGMGAMLLRNSHNNDNEHLISSLAQGFVRSSRAVCTFALISLDYKYSLRGYQYRSEGYLEVRSQVHHRAAKRILKLCELNKGFYVKAGQFIASVQYIPKEYSSTLSTLQDKAVPCSFKDIRKVLIESFQKDVMEIYEEFEEQPIASASVAQVHRARLINGKEVAVKIQYPGLQERLQMDISTMKILSTAISWMFPNYQFGWLVPEFEKTLVKELDFLLEAKNAEQAARNFKSRPIKVPKIIWELSSQKVLTMEFIKGCKVDDLQCLQSCGLCPRKVGEALVEAFAEMIFCHGFVHGDPHPGNILVLPHPNHSGRFDIVLLDHGIYQELDEKFRMDLCCLWKALIQLDQNEMQQMGEKLGAGKYYRFLPVIFTGRTLDRYCKFISNI